MEEFIGITEAREKLSGMVAQLLSGALERVVIIRRSKAVAVMLSADDYDQMMKELGR